MRDFDAVSELNLKENEYCTIVGNQYYANSHFNIKIHKLMVDVTPISSESFNKNIFINATSCKPNVSGSVGVKDYITVPRSAQCSLQDKIMNERDEVGDGTVIICQCLNGNYRNMKIIDYL